jgi:hypothetical protein
MSDPASPDPADFPEGWSLGEESWRFHRQFFARLGRTAAVHEYSLLLSQIRYRLAEAIGICGSGGRYYRVAMADGTPLVVIGSWHRLSGVNPGDWTPPVVAEAAAPETARETAAPEPLPPAVSPPARQPLRASTLTLSNPDAARALAARLRRIGVPATNSTRGRPI